MNKIAVLNAKIRPVAIALTAVLTVLAAQGAYAEAHATTSTSVPTTINTDTDHSGILTLAGGTQTVTGTVGVTGARLSQVNSGAAGGRAYLVKDDLLTDLIPSVVAVLGIVPTADSRTS